MIQPTIGRVVLFKGANQPSDGWPALICHVWHARMVNLAGFDANGEPFKQTSVRLLQGDDTPEGDVCWAEWMPYQKGQAERADAAEHNAKLAEAHRGAQLKLDEAQRADAVALMDKQVRAASLAHAAKIMEGSGFGRHAGEVVKAAQEFEAYLRGSVEGAASRAL